MNLDLSKIRQKVEPIFGIDIRALAALRIGLALVMIVQLVNCIAVAGEFFSDRGILPSELHRQLLDATGFERAWTLYSISGDLWFVQTLMVVHLVFAIAFLFGLWTRLATFACLVLVWSLQMRNPWLTTEGDVALRCLLAWCLFLPCGYVWSIDSRIARRQGEQPHEVLGIATVGIMLQVVAFFWFAGIAKLNGDWFSGAALGEWLQANMVVRGLGGWVSTWPEWTLQILTWGVLILELATPLLVFSPWRTEFWRGFATGSFFLVHVGQCLTLTVGILPLVGVIAWLVFVPRETWGGQFYGTRQVSRRNKHRDRWLALPRRLITGGMLMYLILIHLMGIWPAAFERLGYRSLYSLGCGTMFVQEFKRLSDVPRSSPRFEFRGDTLGGDSINLFAASRTMPSTTSAFQRENSQFRRRYFWSLNEWKQRFTDQQPAVFIEVNARLLAYHVDYWNERSVDSVIEARFTCEERPIRRKGESEPVGQTRIQVLAEWNSEVSLDLVDGNR
ncbi:MAG: HTTM domain-containing protein [Pirellulaceae bacterium]|nr:HTTM domain-containing protein [Pirellulaceae bacterium]